MLSALRQSGIILRTTIFSRLHQIDQKIGLSSMSSSTTPSAPWTTLKDYLIARIQVNGPLTVAEFMREYLTNEKWGYYMNKDVFGVHGDFITSPEISQMFGELVGVWIVNEWLLRKNPHPFHLVEFGPGRGTLMSDIIRVLRQFPDIEPATQVHLIEASPFLREQQRRTLSPLLTSSASQEESGSRLHWHNSLRDCSWLWNHNEQDKEGAICFLAHEFLDALPIHKFQKQDGRWHEVMVDWQRDGESSKFTYVLSKKETPAMAAYLPLVTPMLSSHVDHLEVCPEAMALVEDLARLLNRKGTSYFGLLMDYGHTGEKGDTFRAFSKHKLCDPLEAEPGTVDLTADVNFRLLKGFMKKTLQTENALVLGPVTQGQFLQEMGIAPRLQILLKNSTSAEQRENHLKAVQKLVDPKEMGTRFKFMTFMSLTESLDHSYKPPGFCSILPQ